MRHRVLEISSDPVVRAVMKLACEKSGFDVFIASNGDEALVIYHSDGPFEFVLSDPLWDHATTIKDAFHLAREKIRKEFPNQKIGLHTGSEELVNNEERLPCRPGGKATAPRSLAC